MCGFWVHYLAPCNGLAARHDYGVIFRCFPMLFSFISRLPSLSLMQALAGARRCPHGLLGECRRVVHHPCARAAHVPHSKPHTYRRQDHPAAGHCVHDGNLRLSSWRHGHDWVADAFKALPRSLKAEQSILMQALVTTHTTALSQNTSHG